MQDLLRCSPLHPLFAFGHLEGIKRNLHMMFRELLPVAVVLIGFQRLFSAARIKTQPMRRSNAKYQYFTKAVFGGRQKHLLMI